MYVSPICPFSVELVVQFANKVKERLISSITIGTAEFTSILPSIYSSTKYDGLFILIVKNWGVRAVGCWKVFALENIRIIKNYLIFLTMIII